MELHKRQQEILIRKISRRRDEIRKFFVSNITPITDIVYRQTPDYESYQEASKINDYHPIKVGDHWGGEANAWFKVKLVVPQSMKGREVAAIFDFGGEACAYIDGKPYQGIDHNHPELLLLNNAKGGEEFEIIVDVESFEHWDKNREGNPVKFARADLATRNPEVREYWYWLDTLLNLAAILPVNSTRRQRIIYLLNKSVDAFNYTDTDDASLKKSIKAASAIIEPLIACHADPSATNVAVHGHSHIDVAWLWPYRETMRKCSRTFSTVMRLMEQYPEYIFTQSQAQLYDFTKQKYPELYAEIKKRIKEGRWDVCGSMWVEADCNVTGGESLIRQVLVGKNFFMDEFGIETDVLWLPDVFGYSAAVPQILKKARVPYFSTIKISWNQFNKFPYSTFTWKGIDGTGVLAHFPPSGDYNAYPDPNKLRCQVDNFVEKDRCDWSLMSYGWGDGGGGPEARHIELLRRSKDLEGLPRCTQMKVSDFFNNISDCEDLPTWAGELYFELHRGTYTTQARNKLFNRRAEFLFRDAEIFSTIATPLGLPYPYEDLHEEWKKILCNQFHDVIPGSSIHAVYEDTEEMYPKIFAFGEKTVDSALAKVAEKIDTTGEGDAVVVFNSLPWDRSDITNVQLPAKGEYIISDGMGSEVASQVVDNTISFVADVPSMGYSTYRLIKKAPAKVSSSLKVSKKSLENGFYKIQLDNKGLITSLLDKPTGREVVPEGEKLNLLQLFEDKPNDFPAWDIDFYYDQKFDNITNLKSIDVIDGGPVSAGVEIVREFGSSKITQRIVIYEENPRIDFITEVDWHESNKCLKVAFPANVNATKARYEIQFGNVERPTHKNTSWDVARFEVCAHKWADISETGFGLSLMNDCKYGHSASENVISMTLLRSPKEPDPYADMGNHTFTYSLMPHEGDYITARTVRRAYELNVPMRAILTKPTKGDLPAVNSFATIDTANVVLETVKRAEKENATILRFYECHNSQSSATVTLNMPFEKVYECDLMETNIQEVESKAGEFSFEIKPFEIKTFKLV